MIRFERLWRAVSALVVTVFLRLSDNRLDQLRGLQELLVASLRFATPEAWIDAVHRRATEVFGVERSVLILPVTGDRVLVHSPSIDGETLAALEDGLVGTAREVNRYGDPVLNRIMARLAAARLEVWTRPIAERVSGIPLEETPRFYPELVRPARLDQMLVIGHSLGRGRAMFSVFADNGRSAAFGDDKVEIFRLLLPAFKAGSRVWALAGSRWRGLRRSLDRVAEGVVLYRGGEEVYRNRALQRMLASDEEGGVLMARAARCASALLRTLGNGRADPPADASAGVTTAANRYRLSASHLEGGTYGRPAVVMVVIRPAAPPLPGEGALEARYGLTPRQAEVALLVARGRSNREVADRLGISEHTARHHAQRALEKIGASSRKALAMRLVVDQEL